MKKILRSILTKLGIPVYYHAIKARNSQKPIEFNSRVKMYKNFIKKGDLVFDVGANLGNRVDVFLNLGAKIVAIEPQKYCNKFLKIRFGKKIILVKKALGETEGNTTLFTGSLHILSTTSMKWKEEVEKSNRFNNAKWTKKQHVKVTTLDNLIKKYGTPKFIKIDVEGSELQVLNGLSNRINYLSFEYTIPELTNDTIACLNYLNKLGNLECNYSVGESMEFSLINWVSHDKFISVIRNDIEPNAKEKGFGDIYIRFL